MRKCQRLRAADLAMRLQTPAFKMQQSKTATPLLAIAGLIAANIAFVLELTLVPLLLPEIQNDFGLTIEDLSWFFNAYGIAVAAGVLLSGWGGDALNTRLVFCAGVAIFAAGAAVVALAGGFQMLVFGRVLQGLGGGLFSPLVPLLITRVSPQKPGRALIYWGSIAGYVAAFAPFLYSNVFGAYGWQFAILLNALVASVAFAALLVSPVPEQAKASKTVETNYSTFLRARNMWLCFAYVFCSYGCITYYLFFLPVWLTETNTTAISIGFLLSILWLTYAVMSTLLRGLVDGPYLKTIMFAAPLLISASIPILIFDQSVAALVLASVLVGSGLACSNAPSTQLILKFAPKGLSALATSWDITFARIGGILFVYLLADTDLHHAATFVCLSCGMAAYLALIVCKRLSATSRQA